MSEFPISAYDDLIVVPASINGVEQPCVIDTGATYCLLDTSFRQSLGPLVKKTTAGSARGDAFDVEIYSAPEIKVGNVVLRRANKKFHTDASDGSWLSSFQKARDTPGVLLDTFRHDECVACCDMSLLHKATGRDINVFVGVAVFRKSIVRIDFDGHVVRFLPRTVQPQPEWGEPVEVSAVTGGLPAIDVELPNATHEKCIVDTGAMGSIALSSDIFSRLAKEKFIDLSEDELRWEASGLTKVHCGRLSTLKVGRFESSDIRVSDGGKNSRIGLRYLRRFYVSLDLGERRIFLAKGAEFENREKGPALGVGLLRNKDKTAIVDVSHGSRGEQAGIRKDDELVAINGAPVKDYSIQKIQWMFRESADARGNLRLTLRREGTELDVVAIVEK